MPDLLSALSAVPAPLPSVVAASNPNSATPPQGPGSFAGALAQAQDAPSPPEAPAASAGRRPAGKPAQAAVNAGGAAKAEAPKTRTETSHKADKADKAAVDAADGDPATREAAAMADTDAAAGDAATLDAQALPAAAPTAAADADPTAAPDDQAWRDLLPGWTAHGPDHAVTHAVPTPATPDGRPKATAAPTFDGDGDPTALLPSADRRGREAATRLPGARADVGLDTAARGRADARDPKVPDALAGGPAATAAASAGAASASNPATALPLPGGFASLLGGALQAPSGVPATTSPFQARLSAAVGSADFAPALGVQVSLLVAEGVQQAELHLNPAEMGPVTVQIALDGQQAQVHFQAEHASTRDALQDSLPTLASALNDAGFTLTGGGVSQQQSSRQDGQPGARDGLPGGSASTGGGAASTGAEAEPTARPVVFTGRGLVDLVA
jgi:flagellar hook-length control protein FliK